MVDVLRMRLLKEDMRDQIMKAFSDKGARKDKTVCIDPSLISPLQTILETRNLQQRLREKNVVEVFTWSTTTFHTSQSKVVYLLRPRPEVMKTLSKHVKHLTETAPGKVEIVVYLVPRKTILCEHILEEYHCLHLIELRELEGVDLFPIESDVLSMELELPFRELMLDGDASSLYCIAKSLKKLQEFFGLFPKVRGKGSCAERVCRMLERMRHESGADAEVGQTPEIDSVYLIDREVDLLTPLMTQVTYEGLIDELYGIEGGAFLPPFEVKQSMTKEGRQSKVRLDSAVDAVFPIARDANIVSGQCRLRLHQRALDLKEREDSRSKLKDLREIKIFMQKLPQLQQEKADLGLHLGVASQLSLVAREVDFAETLEVERRILDNEEDSRVQEFITDRIFCQRPLQQVLRLVCLLSLANGGLKGRLYDQLKTQLVQSYGIEVLLTLENLEKAGLMRRQEGRGGVLPGVPGFSGFSGGQMGRLRQQLSLCQPATTERTGGEEAPNVADVYHGYAPISVRLIEQASLGQIRGWHTLESVLSQLPGPNCTYPPDDRGGDVRSPDETGTHRVVLVFFIGGCTRSEVSALRTLTRISERMADRGAGVYTHYLVATTNLLSGNGLIESLYGVHRYDTSR